MKTTEELKNLLYKNETVADAAPNAIAAAQDFCEGYKTFLDNAKTEREATAYSEKLLTAAGYQKFVPGTSYAPGTKVYTINREKCVLAATIGTKNLEEGFHLNIAHIDSPRLDLRPVPVFEKTDIGYLRTHYYGGVRKYQWPTIPLALHGVIYRADGTRVNVCIGEKSDDPVFCITDLLPHLAKDQMAKHGSDIIPGEYLNLLAGSVPYAGEGTKRVMLAVMSLLNDRYDITEEDFLSAELEVVPSFEACDIGVDRSFIGGYGQDDRVCAYAELKAIFDTETPDRTAVCVLADKEEIGSMGVSGMQSRAFETFMADLCEQQDVHLRDCFENSFCVSADVCNAYDPTFWDVSEYPNRNGARANYGVGICKFTGSRGKSGSNDASAEVVGKMRKIFADNGVVWQMSELGKVDQGGGGTVAQYMANRNIDTIDAGTPVFSMHAPFETVTKFDCYQTYKAMWAFYKDR